MTPLPDGAPSYREAVAVRDVVKSRLLPAGPRRRRLPFGIGRGLSLNIDFAIQTKMFLGLYEVELNRHLRRLCQPGFTAFDVGGQFGYDALVMAKLTRAKVVSLESEAALCEEIEANLSANPAYAPLVQVRRAFVTDRSDPATGALALDDLATSTPPDVIKIDIEGGEVDALKGAERTLRQRPPNLLIEVHSAALEEQCVAILDRHGYRPTVVDPRRWLPDHRPISHNRWLVAARPSQPSGD